MTGGGSGIGRGLAVAFHEAGNRVVVAGRRIEALRAVADEHPGITCLELDQSERHSIGRFVDELRRHTDLNVLVINAGMIALEDLSDPDPDVASAVISTNLLGPVVLTSLLLPTSGLSATRQSSTSRLPWRSFRWPAPRRTAPRKPRCTRTPSRCGSSCRTAAFMSSR